VAEKDLGETAWEQRLIRELRTRHYQWRTEQTYRMWASRFARWLEGRAPSRPQPTNGHDGAWPSKTVEAATEEDVRDFLSDLATRQRGSASTQKQALNALVFLLREALAKPLADFSDFTRARPHLNIPVVLTREECQQLFAALDGTMQLMAELMYGSVDKAVGLSAISRRLNARLSQTRSVAVVASTYLVGLPADQDVSDGGEVWVD
jgi:site-specific recombinase XerD